jgi:hypothetical protein
VRSNDDPKYRNRTPKHLFVTRQEYKSYQIVLRGPMQNRKLLGTITKIIQNLALVIPWAVKFRVIVDFYVLIPLIEKLESCVMHTHQGSSFSREDNGLHRSGTEYSLYCCFPASRIILLLQQRMVKHGGMKTGPCGCQESAFACRIPAMSAQPSCLQVYPAPTVSSCN